MEILGTRLPSSRCYAFRIGNPNLNLHLPLLLGGGVDPTYEQLPAVARLCLITCCLGFSSCSLFACGSSFSPGTSGFKNKHIAAPSEEKYLETNKLFSVLSLPQIRFENHPSEFGFGKENTHRAKRILVVFFTPSRRADVLKGLFLEPTLISAGTGVSKRTAIFPTWVVDQLPPSKKQEHLHLLIRFTTSWIPVFQ